MPTRPVTVLGSLLVIVLATGCADAPPASPIGAFDGPQADAIAKRTNWFVDRGNITNEALIAVWGTSADNVWAGGSNGALLHWDGSTWSETTVGTSQFFGIHGLAEDDVWAVTNNGELYHFDGSDWTLEASTGVSGVWSVWAADENNVFFAGNQELCRFNTTSGQQCQTTLFQQNYRVWGTSLTNVFATAVSGVVMRYNGTSWTPMATGATGFLLGIEGTSGNNIFAVGEGGAIVHFDGSSWSTVTSPVVNDFYHLDVVSPTLAYAVTWKGEVVKYDGSNWTVVNAGTVTTDWYEGVWAASESDFFGVGVSGLIVRSAHNQTVTNLDAVASTGQIALTWTEDTDDETRLEVRRRERVGGVWSAYSIIAQPAANAVGHIDASVVAGRLYAYQVRGCHRGRCSAWSDQVRERALGT